MTFLFLIFASLKHTYYKKKIYRIFLTIFLLEKLFWIEYTATLNRRSELPLVRVKMANCGNVVHSETIWPILEQSDPFLGKVTHSWAKWPILGQSVLSKAFKAAVSTRISLPLKFDAKSTSAYVFCFHLFLFFSRMILILIHLRMYILYFILTHTHTHTQTYHIHYIHTTGAIAQWFEQ